MRRVENTATQDLLKACFICGIENEQFNKRREKGFIKHTKDEHYMYNYFFMYMSLASRDPTTFTGQESFIMDSMENGRIEEILPFKRALCLEWVATVATEEVDKSDQDAMQDSNAAADMDADGGD